MLKKVLVFFSILLVFVSCKGHNGGDATEQNVGKVKFFNNSSFKVDLYMNINPSTFDINTKPLVSLEYTGDSKTLDLPPSSDQNKGDHFYIHYKVPIADGLSSGVGKPIYAKARRDISNVHCIIKKDSFETIEIPNPNKGQLKFFYGYIKVENLSDYSIDVIKADSFLERLGTDVSSLGKGQSGYYRVKAPEVEDKLKAVRIDNTGDGSSCDIEPFAVEEGKVLVFSYDGTKITKKAPYDITY